MEMFLKVLLFLYPLVALSYGGNTDMCDKIKLIQNFDAKKTEGIWYAQEVDGYGLNDIGNCSKIDITGVNGVIQMSELINGKYEYSDLTFIQEGNTSKYNLKSGSQISYPHYWVDTDYNNFMIYYICFTGKGTVNILTRARNPGAKIIGRAKEAMTKKGFNPDKMTALKQNNCTN